MKPVSTDTPPAVAWAHSQVVQCLRPHARSLALLLALQVAQSLATLSLPSLSADVINLGVARGDHAYVLRLGAVMLAVALAQVAFAVGATAVGARLAIGYGRDLRGAVFAHVQDFGLHEVRRFGIASLITRTTNDVQQLQIGLLMLLTMIVSAPIMAVGGVVMAVRQNAGLSSLLAVSIPLLLVAVLVLMSRTIPYFQKMQGQLDRLGQILREQITGLRVIRAFVRDTQERQRFAVVNAALTDTALYTGRLMAVLIPMAVLIMQWSIVALVWFAASRIGAGTMEVGSLVAFVAYVAQILMSAMMAALLFAIVPRALVCARRIEEVLATPPSVQEPSAAKALPALAQSRSKFGGIVFQQVGFQYPGALAPALRDITLHIAPGQTVGIIGATGSGKTTLLNLVPRL